MEKNNFQTRKQDNFQTRVREYSSTGTLPPDIKEGQLINDRYLILQKIGSGSYGEVYKAYDQNIKIDKALKFIESNQETNFEDEAKILATLTHPSVIRLYDIHKWGNYSFLDLEYFEGVPLNEFLKRNHLQANASPKIINSLIEGFCYLEEKNILHFDIKAHNVLIKSNNELKITDFGLSRELPNRQTEFHSLKSKDDRNELISTIAYSAPESLTGQSHDLRSEIFSMGILLYEIVYRRYPFDFNEKGEPVYKTPASLSSSDKAIDAMISKCLKVNPALRYQSFKELLKDYENSIKKPDAVHTIIKHEIIEKNQSAKTETSYLKYIIPALLISFILFLTFSIIIIMVTHNNTSVLTRITGKPSYLFRNSSFTAKTPGSYIFEANDLLEIRDSEERIIFQMTPENLKRNIHLDIGENEITINNQLRGLIVRNLRYVHRDTALINHLISINDSLDFALLDAPIHPEILRSIRAFRICIGDNFPDSLIFYLPSSLRRLIIINRDIEDSPVPYYADSIKHLDLTGTRASMRFIESFRNVDSLSINPSLISDFSVSRIPSGLKKLVIDEYSDIEIPRSNHLPFSISRTASTHPNQHKSASDSQMEQIKNELQRISYTYLKDNEVTLVFSLFLLLILCFLFLILLFFRIRKKSGKISHVKDNAQADPIQDNQSIRNEKNTIDTLLSKIDSAVSENRLFLPFENNAVYYLRLGFAISPYSLLLRERKRLVLKKIIARFNIHRTRKEFEPIYIYSGIVLENIFERKIKKLLTMSAIKLLHKVKETSVSIKGGLFLMGDFETQLLSNCLPLHNVTISDFKISCNLVTNRQYCDFLNAISAGTIFDNNWIKLSGQYTRIIISNGKFCVVEPYNNFPVYEVNWYGAAAYCQWVGGRLPTEAEWEYAARSKGKRHSYATGKEISLKTANYLVSEDDERWHSVKPVQSYKANKAGLYDFSGNLAEWCLDSYAADFYIKSPELNPVNNAEEINKVIRGGAWCFSAERAKTYFRGYIKATSRTNYIGFRVVFPQ